MEESGKSAEYCQHTGQAQGAGQVTDVTGELVRWQVTCCRSCSDPEVDRDSDDVDVNDDDTQLDDELDDECFLQYDKQDSKSIC